MKFGISIGHVSGDEAVHLTTTDLHRVDQFLDENDHEGSVVGLDIECQTSEESLRLLKLLRHYSNYNG